MYYLYIKKRKSLDLICLQITSLCTDWSAPFDCVRFAAFERQNVSELGNSTHPLG